MGGSQRVGGPGPGLHHPGPALDLLDQYLYRFGGHPYAIDLTVVSPIIGQPAMAMSSNPITVQVAWHVESALDGS